MPLETNFGDVHLKKLGVGGRIEKDPELHVSVEGVVGEVGAGDQEGVVDEGALGVEFPGFARLVAFPTIKGPVVDLWFGE